MSNVRLVDPMKDRLVIPRRHLVRACRSALASEVAGYALVVWDRDGGTSTYIRTSERVGRRILPAIVHDSLMQHITLDMLDDTAVDYPPDPEGA
jgi:hypothetical protein